MTLGDVIQNYRKEHDLSQRQFALRSGISNGYISMLEKGINPQTNAPIIPSLSMLKSISSAMNMSLNDLISMADDIQVDISASTNSTSLHRFPDSDIDFESVVKLVESYCGEDVAVMLRSYSRLDSNDQAEIRGEIKQMLKADKYKKKDLSKSKAI